MQLNICSYIVIVIITGVMYPFGKRVNNYRYYETYVIIQINIFVASAYKSSALYLFND